MDDETLLRSKKIPRGKNDVCKKGPRWPNTFTLFIPCLLKSTSLTLRGCWALLATVRWLRPSLKPALPRLCRSVFFFSHMASSPHPHRRLLSLVAFTGCFHWSGGQSVARSLKQSASGADSRSASEEEISEHWKILEAHDWQQSYQSIPKVLYWGFWKSFVLLCVAVLQQAVCWPKSSNFAPGLHTWSNFNH